MQSSLPLSPFHIETHLKIEMRGFVWLQVESLRTKMAGRMGDRLSTAKPELDQKLKKLKEKREREERARLEEQKSKKKSRGGVFLDTLGANNHTILI